MSSRKILIISYYWPPSGGVGVQRWMNFSLQLKNLGWEPMVLTPDNPQFEIKDEHLLERVKEIPTYTVPIWEPFNFFHQLTGGKERKNIQQGLVLEKSDKTFKDHLAVWVRGNLLIPDPRVFWVRKASNRAIELVKMESIDTIITTGPPHSMHLVGRRVKRKTGVKWLADFRDPWSKWDVLTKLRTSALAMSLHKKLEASVLKETDIATTVSKRLAQAFGGIEVLHNGITVRQKEQITPDHRQFTIGYFGMLSEFRNPSTLWMLLDQLCRENPDFSSKLTIRIGGIVAESIKDELSRLKELEGKIEFLGYLSHEQVQKEYQKCNLLLLLQNKSNNSEWILPVKFFEYLAAHRMILCLGERSSDLGDLMNGREIGEILSYAAIDEMRAFILDVFEHARKPNGSDIEDLMRQFSHERLVRQLENYLTKLNEQH